VQNWEGLADNGLDLGTGGVRVLAVDWNKLLRRREAIPFSPTARLDRAESIGLGQASLSALSDVTGQLDGHRALALGLSGQMHAWLH